MFRVSHHSESLELVRASWKSCSDDSMCHLPELHDFSCDCDEAAPGPTDTVDGDCGCGPKTHGAQKSAQNRPVGVFDAPDAFAALPGRNPARESRRASSGQRVRSLQMPSTSLAPSRGRGLFGSRGGGGAQTRAPLVAPTMNAALSSGTLSSTQLASLPKQPSGGVRPPNIEEHSLFSTSKEGVSTDGTGTPCDLTVSEPPPDTYTQESPEWYAWWNGCIPRGPVGPGVDAGCDPEKAWYDALELCTERCLERVEQDYGEPWYVVAEEIDLNCWNDNFVFYAWIVGDCEVIDAICGISSSGQAVWIQEPEGFYGSGGDYQLHDYWETIFRALGSNESENTTETANAGAEGTTTTEEGTEDDPEYAYDPNDPNDPNRPACDACANFAPDPCAQCPEDCWFFGVGEECYGTNNENDSGDDIPSDGLVDFGGCPECCPPPRLC